MLLLHRKDCCCAAAAWLSCSAACGSIWLAGWALQAAPPPSPRPSPSHLQMRWAALNVMVKAFKSQIPVAFLALLLGFQPAAQQQEQQAATAVLPGCRRAAGTGKAAAEASEEEGIEACVEWLRAHGATVEEGAAGEGAALQCTALSYLHCTAWSCHSISFVMGASYGASRDAS